MANNNQGGTTGPCKADTASLLKGAAGAFIFKVIGALAGFGFAVLIARYLGAAQAGIFYTAMPFVIMGAYLARFGLDQVAMREVAGTAELGHDIRPLIRRLLVIGITGALIGALLLAAGAPIAADFYDMPDLIWVLPIFALALAFVALFNLVGQVIRGMHNIWKSSFILFAGHNLFSLGLLSLAAWTNISHEPLSGAAWAYTIGAIIITTISLYMLKKQTHDTEVTYNHTTHGYKTILSMAQPLLLYGIGTMSLQWVSTLALAASTTPADVAIFNSALRVSQAVGFILIAIITAVGPRYAALFKAGRESELRHAHKQTTLLTCAVATPIVITLWATSTQIMTLFGEEFQRGGNVLTILVFSQLLAALAGPASQLIIAKGKEKSLRNITLTIAAINIPLNLGLIHQWGLLGGAIASAISIAALNLGTFLLSITNQDPNKQTYV